MKLKFLSSKLIYNVLSFLNKFVFCNYYIDIYPGSSKARVYSWGSEVFINVFNIFPLSVNYLIYNCFKQVKLAFLKKVYICWGIELTVKNVNY